ncbi:MAG: thermonuclease family protein [Anaerosomatales bacterium]|nr:thermonuclease family protein [Anaerosomatales bacterium]
MQKDSKDSRNARRWFILAAVAVAFAIALAGCSVADQTPRADQPAPASASTRSVAPRTADSTTEPAGDGGDTAPPAASVEGDGALPAIEATRAAVVRVVDGDTAVFRLGDGREEKTRFIGIDTPESTTRHEPFGAEASAYTKRALPRGRAVWLETDADLRDRYGRLLAYVWLELPGQDPDAEAPAKMLNAKLALDGYATQLTIPPNVRYAHVFAECVARAREAGRGLWRLQP